MNTDTTIKSEVLMPVENQHQPLSLVQGGRDVSVFEKVAVELMRRPDADIDKLQQIMFMHERWEERQAEKAFVAAMTRFKQNPPKIVKEKMNGYENRQGEFVGYKSATLAAVCDAAIKGLAEVGISHKWEVQQGESANGFVSVSCVLTHDLGHSERTTINAPADNSGKKNAIQSIASSITYLQRYTLLAATGLAAEDQDDDGAGHADPRKQEDWIDVMLESLHQAEDLAGLMAAWKTAAGTARRRKAREAYDEFKDAVTKRCGELGISAEQWAAAAAEKKS